MKKKPTIISEGFSADADESAVAPFMADIKPSSVPPPSELIRVDGETQEDFDARRVIEILHTFYDVPLEKLESPIRVSPELTRPGVTINLPATASSPLALILSMDFPESLHELLEQAQGHLGCRLSLMGFTLDEVPPSVPNPATELRKFFKGLPATVSYAPWQVSPLSNPGLVIYEALLVAPANLHYHLAADSLARVLDWLTETYGY